MGVSGMRTIKFRAWDGELMHDVSELHFCMGPKLDGKGLKFYGPGVGSGWIDGENINLMQFTGLHDKNGKEIYESDIFHMGDPNITYTVVWHDTGFKGKQNGSSSFAGLEHWQERIEVISNIYEQEQTK